MSDDTVTLPKAQADALMRGMTLLQKLDSDPRSKALVEDAVKLHFPEVRTSKEETEAQIAPLMAPVRETLEKINARLEAEDTARKEAADKAVETRLETDFAKLSSQGYTNEGLEKIKALMIDRGIADPYAAAALFDKSQPKVSDVSSYTPQNWDLGAGHAQGDSLKELFANEDAWAEKQIGVVLNDMRGGGDR